jgi:proteic killer suppression protein
MIRTFQHRGPRRLYEHGDRAGIGAAILSRVEEISMVLEAVESVDLPGYRLHRLTGDLRGFDSIRVTGN